MAGHGGDHELDVAAILRRAKDPDDLGALRRAIDELKERESTEWIAELLGRMQGQLAQLTRAVESLATRPQDDDHLVAVGGMDSFTKRIEILPGLMMPAVEPPPVFVYFDAFAIAVDLIGDDPLQKPDVTIQGMEIRATPQIPGELAPERWEAPPGRGHPIRWLFGPCTLASELRVLIHSKDRARLRMTFYGKGLQSPPPGRAIGGPVRGDPEAPLVVSPNPFRRRRY